jgi:hypothetical protein
VLITSCNAESLQCASVVSYVLCTVTPPPAPPPEPAPLAVADSSKINNSVTFVLNWQITHWEVSWGARPAQRCLTKALHQ